MWQRFLDSLTTTGGKMLVLIAFILFFIGIAVVMHMSGHDPAEEGKLLLSNAFTALFTSLMGYLSRGDVQ